MSSNEQHSGSNDEGDPHRTGENLTPENMNQPERSTIAHTIYTNVQILHQLLHRATESAPLVSQVTPVSDREFTTEEQAVLAHLYLERLTDLAAACYCSKSTINRRLKDLYTKCKVKNRTALTIWATQQGYCRLPPDTEAGEP